MAHHFILLRLNPFGLRVDREGLWFERSMSQLRVSLSAEGAKKDSWPWRSLLRGWGSLTMTSTCKFVSMAHHFILLWLNTFSLGVEREGWWFERCVSQFQDCLSAEGANNISWPWLSLLPGWAGVTMTSTGKFVYMAHHFILLRLSAFGLGVDKEGWWFEHRVSQLPVCL